MRIYIDFNIPSCNDKLAIAMDENNWAGIPPSEEHLRKIIFDDYPDAYNLKVQVSSNVIEIVRR